MKYTYFDQKFVASTPAESRPDKEAFIAGLIARRKYETRSAAEINAFLTENMQDQQGFVPFTELPEEDRAARRALSDALFEKFAKRSADKLYSDLPSDGNLRYPSDLMMKHGDPREVGAYNQKVSRAVCDPKNNTKEFIRLHVELLSRLDENHAMELVTGDLTDEEKVRGFDRITTSAGIVFQFQNISENLDENRLGALDEEDRANLARCQEMMNKYQPYVQRFNNLESSLSLIENPYYAVFDNGTPEFLSNTAVVARNALRVDYADLGDKNPFDGRSLFDDYVMQRSYCTEAILDGEIHAGYDLLTLTGSSPENIVYRVIGGEDGTSEEKPLNPKSSRMLREIQSAHGMSLEIYDRTDRDRRPVLTVPFGTDETYQRMMSDPADREPQAPAGPDEVEAPGPKPGTGFFATVGRGLMRALHAVSFGVFFDKTLKKYDAAVAAHAQQTAEYANYLREESEYQKANEIFKARRAVFEARNPFYYSKQPGKITNGLGERMMQNLCDPAYRMRSFIDMYGAQREKRIDWIANTSTQVYNHKTANAMQKTNFVLDESCCPNGVKVDNETFAKTAAIASLWKPIYDRHGKAPDTISFEDVVLSSNQLNPRASMHSHIVNMVEPAREKIAESLRNFDRQIPGTDPAVTGRQQLADILADGLKTAEKKLINFKWDQASHIVCTDVACDVLAFADRLGLAEDLRARGVGDSLRENLAAAKKISQVTQESLEAKLKLVRENQSGETMPAAEKYDCYRKIALQKTLSAEVYRVNSKAAEMEVSPTSRPGESPEEFNARVAAWTQKYMESINGGALENTAFSPLIVDYAKGGTQLKEAADALIPGEYQDALLGEPQADAYQKLTGTNWIKVYDTQCEERERIRKAAEQAEAEEYSYLAKRADDAYRVINDVHSSPKQIQEAAAVIITCRTVKNHPVTAGSFDRSVEEIKSQEAFEELTADTDAVRAALGGSVNRARAEDRLLSDFRDAVISHAGASGRQEPADEDEVEMEEPENTHELGDDGGSVIRQD